jgi:hypothetical protein
MLEEQRGNSFQYAISSDSAFAKHRHAGTSLAASAEEYTKTQRCTAAASAVLKRINRAVLNFIGQKFDIDPKTWK